jgi:hypothetical protein
MPLLHKAATKAGVVCMSTANAAGINSLTCLPKQEKASEEARDNKFLVTHLITDQRCLTSATAGPSNYSKVHKRLNFETYCRRDRWRNLMKVEKAKDVCKYRSM